MKYFSLNLLIVLLFVTITPIILCGQSQFKNNNNRGLENRLQFSFGIGYPIVSSRKGYDETLKESNLYHDAKYLAFFYNKVQVSPAVDFKVVYYFNKYHGLGFNLSNANTIRVEGGAIGDAGFIEFYFDSNFELYSLMYQARLRNSRNYFYVGPIIGTHRIISNSKYISTPDSKKAKYGVLVGYTFNFVQKERIYLAVNFDLRLMEKAIVGPIEAEYTTDGYSTPFITTSGTFKEKEMNLSSFTLGIIIGFKIWK